jgi:HEAT repeat protein
VIARGRRTGSPAPIPGSARAGWRSVLVGASLAAAVVGQGVEAQTPGSEPVYRGRPLGDWRQELQSGHPMIRERAVVALCELGEPAVPLLVGAIGDQDFNVRTLAIFCLGRMGPKAKEAVPVLVQTLGDRDWIVRRYAAGALGYLEGTAAGAAPALARTAVEDASPDVRQTATFSLGRLGPEARETVQATLRQIGVTGADEAVRTRAAELLREMEKR